MTKELVWTYELPKREIKFRAWDTRNKQWYSPTHEAYKGDLRELLINFSWQLSAHTMQGLEHESLWKDRYILMQYTWLKDKNWKEIYEGDIMSDWINKALVKYDMDYAAYVLKREDNNIFLFFTREVDKFSPLHINIPYNLEIIGNIYENPDLLPTPPDAN